MQEIYTLSQAAQELRVSPNTVTAWAGKLGIALRLHPHDKRIKMLSAEEVEQIRKAMVGRNALLRPQAFQTPNHPPALPPASSESPHRASQGHSVRSASSNLPDGWVTYKQMCLRHSISERTADKAIAKGIISITIGEYRVGTADTKRVLSPEQQAIFLEWLQSRG